MSLNLSDLNIPQQSVHRLRTLQENFGDRREEVEHLSLTNLYLLAAADFKPFARTPNPRWLEYTRRVPNGSYPVCPKIQTSNASQKLSVSSPAGRIRQRNECPDTTTVVRTQGVQRLVWWAELR